MFAVRGTETDGGTGTSSLGIELLMRERGFPCVDYGVDCGGIGEAGCW